MQEKKMTWDKEAITTLTNLWKLGFSTARIAEMMDTTKNSICGKVRRMGLPMRKPQDKYYVEKRR